MKQTNNDTPWKNILTRFLQAFMEFCLPKVATSIDWSKGYTSLDKELRIISRQQAIGKRIADALFQVWLKDGKELWLLVHLEVQAQKETAFPERMYVYNYRIFDRYQMSVMSVAILADGNPNWRPGCYERSIWDNRLRFEFATIKLLDYANQKEKLTRQTNPFAIVIWAHLAALESRRDVDLRLQSKLAVTRALYAHGFGKDYILQLFSFIDWVLALPEPFELEYAHYIEQLEEEKQVSYITSIERIGIQKGMQQGMQQGEATIILRLVQRRFGPISKTYKQRITQADANTLLAWGDKILEAQTLEDFFEEGE